MTLMQLHVTLCILLMLVILIQPGSSSEIGSLGQSQWFGSVGATPFLVRSTLILCVSLVVTTLQLNHQSIQTTRQSRENMMHTMQNLTTFGDSPVLKLGDAEVVEMVDTPS